MVGVRPGTRRLAEVNPPLVGSLGATGTLGVATPSVHPEAWIAPGAVVVGSVAVGRGSSIWYGSVLRADDEAITIGDECNVQDLCCIHVDPGEPAVLADRVSLGHHATVHGASIGPGALIGIGAVVLGRGQVGAGALVAAGAVVLPGTVVPAGVLFAGVPGRVIRELSGSEIEHNEMTARRYVDRAIRHREARWDEPTGD